MKKILYLDTETTGLNPKVHDVVQIAGIVEINGRMIKEFSFHCQPFDFSTIQPTALKVNKLTMQDLKSFDPPIVAVAKFIACISEYVDRYEPSDKFVIAAHNSQFDYNFVKNWWQKAETKIPFHSFFSKNTIDTLAISKTLIENGYIGTKSAKLESLAGHYNLSYGERGAHDALADTRVMRDLYKKILPITNKAKTKNVSFSHCTYEEAMNV